MLEFTGQSLPIYAKPFEGLYELWVNRPKLFDMRVVEDEEKNETQSYVDLLRTMRYSKQAAGKIIAEEGELRDTSQALNSLGLPAVNEDNLVHAYPRVLVGRYICSQVLSDTKLLK